MRSLLLLVLAALWCDPAARGASIDAAPPPPFPPVAKSSGFVLVKFTGPACIPCQRLAPKLRAAMPRGLKVWEFSNDNPAHEHWFRQWRVERVPATFLMTEDGRTLASLHGDATPEQVAAFFAAGVPFCPGRACGGPSTCPQGGECLSCLACANAKAAPRLETHLTTRSPVGHTHTCPRCGTTWDHAANPGHNCPNCGTSQYVQDRSPRAVTVKAVREVAQPASPPLESRGYSVPWMQATERQVYRQPQHGEPPLVISVGCSASSGGCASGNCGTTTTRRGLFR